MVDSSRGVRTIVGSLLDELRLRPWRPADVNAALASLVVNFDDSGLATISRLRSGMALFNLRLASQTPVARRSRLGRVAPGAYTETPTSEGRVRLLSAVAAFADRVEVHAPISTDGSYRGRLAFDVPRRIARCAGIPMAEPGDRLSGAFKHAFFDDEALITEARRARLEFVARRGAWIVLEPRATPPTEHASSFSREVGRALVAARDAERSRLRDPPRDAIERMRARGRLAAARGAIGRSRLRCAIGWVDAFAPFRGGPNCFRRTLLEIALDGGAAREAVVFGLDVGKTGHATLKDAEELPFDVAFEFPP
jgi:hypothetical protein